MKRWQYLTIFAVMGVLLAIILTWLEDITRDHPGHPALLPLNHVLTHIVLWGSLVVVYVGAIILSTLVVKRGTTSYWPCLEGIGVGGVLVLWRYSLNVSLPIPGILRWFSLYSIFVVSYASCMLNIVAACQENRWGKFLVNAFLSLIAGFIVGFISIFCVFWRM